MTNVRNQIEQTTATAKKCSSVFGSLFKYVSFAVIGRQLLSLSKQAINMASDLAEVQNVVDVAFGNMANEVDEFAKTTIVKFGMSELSAKQFASTFMAMGNGMGVAKKQGKDMAIALTGLAGDMASFYNVSQDVAATALNSIYTGETETLKKFGVVMSEVNLQEFANAQGIHKKLSAMTQAEKVALRYAFVMKATANAQGDFARTSDGWANQVRILQEQWKSFIGLVGNGLMQALLPLIKTLNTILSYFVSIGNAIAKAFGGKSIKSSSSNVDSVASGLDDATDGASGLTSGLDDATKAAKELKRQTMSFDELNIMSSNPSTGSSGSGGSGGASGSGGGGSVSTSYVEDIEETESTFDALAQKLQEFKDGLPELVINFDKEQAMEDLKVIKESVAGFVKNFASTVITIAIKILNDLDIGRLGNDVLHLIARFTNLAKTISEVLKPIIIDFYDKAISPLVKWIGEKLHDALKFAADLMDDWADWFVKNKDNLKKFSDKVADVIVGIEKLLKPIADGAWKIFKDVIKGISDVMQTLGEHLDVVVPALGIFVGLWEGFKLLSIIGQMGGLTAALGALTAGLWANVTAKIADKAETLVLMGMYAKDAVLKGASAIKTAALTVATWAQHAAQVALNFVMNLNPITIVIAAIAALVAIFVVLWKKCDGFREFWLKLWDAIKKAAKAVADWFKEAWNDVVKFFTEFIPKKFNEAKDAISGVWDKIKNAVKAVTDWFKDTWNDVAKFFTETIPNKFNAAKDAITGIWDKIKTGVHEKAESIKTGVHDKFEKVKETMTNAMETAKNNVSTKLEHIKAAYESKGGGIKGVVAGMMTAVKDNFTGAFNYINNITGGRLNDIRNKFSNVLNNAKNIVANVLSKIKNLFHFTWSLPKLKLPHFSITPKGWKVGDLLKGVKPTLGISWYAKGGIFNNPSLIGVGEAGKEAVLPLEGKNASWMDTFADKVASRNGTAPTRLVLQIDGKTLAQTTIKNINDLTRQTGSLQLVIV